MKPTQAQIDAEIKVLKEIKPKVRHYTSFGDDNHRAIEIEIEVLSNNYDIDDIDERWDGENLHERMAAQGAREWLDGDSEEESISEGWKNLIAE